jgi:RHS repeat-associated protein
MRIVQNTNPNNAIDALYDYTPYGKLSRKCERTGTSYLHKGKERDTETGLDYFDARNFDSDLGRFLSVDPMASKAPGLTPYRYCFDNPVNLTDPSRLFEGDYYNNNGEYLGSDNIDDNRVYTVNTSMARTNDAPLTFL